MAVLNIVGFETGDTAEASNTSGTLSVQATVKRTGGYALRVNPTGTGAGLYALREHANGADGNFNAADVWHRVYFRVATAPGTGDEPILAAVTATQINKFELRLNSSRQLVAYNQALTLLATGTTALALNTWYRIEVRGGTGAAANWEVRIDGTTEISGTGDLTTTNNGRLQLGKVANRNGNSVDFFYDDVAVDNATWPGAGQIEIMQPDANGFYTGFSAGAGVGDWRDLDEMPTDGDTTYLKSTANGNAVTVNLESAANAGISGTVKCVKTLSSTVRDGAANSTMQARIRSGSTDATSGNAGVLGSYGLRAARLLETDPATGAAWTIAGLDGVEAGVVDNDATDRMRVSTVALAVDFVPGGTTYLQSVAGTLTSSAGLVKRGQPLVSGTLTSSGALVKQAGKVATGTLNTSGAVLKQTTRALTGALTSAGTLAAVRTILIALVGTLSADGAVAKQAGKGAAGALTSTGALSKQTARALAGTLTSAGSLARQTARSLAGVLSAAATLTGTKLTGLTQDLLAFTLSLTRRTSWTASLARRSGYEAFVRRRLDFTQER